MKMYLRKNFSTRLPYAKKKMRNTFFMTNIKYKTQEVGTSPDQKTKLKKFLAKMK